MKKIFACLFLALFFIPFLKAQTEVPLPKSLQNSRSIGKNSDRKVKFLVGGNFGLQLGTYTAVEVSPQFGIYPVKWLLVGIGATYNFSWDSYYLIARHTYGFNGFLQGYLWKRLILHAGYEYLNYPVFYTDLSSKRFDLHAFNAGLGYRQYITEKVSVFGLILFNVYQSTDYYSRGFVPIIKAGVNVDL